jgi:hypothetical protein
VNAALAYADKSGADLAKHLEFSESTWKRALKEDRPFRTWELNLVADVCGVPRDFLRRGFDGAMWLAPDGERHLDEPTTGADPTNAPDP